jgi:hypothetical protein
VLIKWRERRERTHRLGGCVVIMAALIRSSFQHLVLWYVFLFDHLPKNLEANSLSSLEKYIVSRLQLSYRLRTHQTRRHSPAVATSIISVTYGSNFLARALKISSYLVLPRICGENDREDCETIQCNCHGTSFRNYLL